MVNSGPRTNRVIGTRDSYLYLILPTLVTCDEKRFLNISCSTPESSHTWFPTDLPKVRILSVRRGPCHSRGTVSVNVMDGVTVRGFVWCNRVGTGTGGEESHEVQER